MSSVGKAMSNQWMIDLAAFAQKEVHQWPTWKQEGFGIRSAGDKPKVSSGSAKQAKKVA